MFLEGLSAVIWLAVAFRITTVFIFFALVVIVSFGSFVSLLPFSAPHPT